MSSTTFEYVWPKIAAKAWSDLAFKNRLIADPKSVFTEHGVEVPSGTTIHMHESDATTWHVSLPQRPEGELAEENLAAIDVNQSRGCCPGE